MNTIIFILIWWAFVAIVGFCIFAFMRFLSRPASRNSGGDISTEVGYSTDSYGCAKQTDVDNDSSAVASEEQDAQERAVGHQAGPG